MFDGDAGRIFDFKRGAPVGVSEVDRRIVFLDVKCERQLSISPETLQISNLDLRAAGSQFLSFFSVWQRRIQIFLDINLFEPPEKISGLILNFQIVPVVFKFSNIL